MHASVAEVAKVAKVAYDDHLVVVRGTEDAMTTTDQKRPTTKGKVKTRGFAADIMYRIDNPRTLLPDTALPKGTSLFVVPETPAAEARLHGWVIKQDRGAVPLPMKAPPKRSVSPAAYKPSARAKAVLRGVAIAEEDLKAADGTYDVDEVRTLLRNVSRQAVDKRVAEGSLLAVPGPSGARRFPAAQFAGDGSVVKGLKEVQATLGFESKWSVLNFLVNAHDLLGDERPIDVLRRGDVDRVVEAAKLTGVHGA